MGPMDHGFCASIYFAGPENLSLELAYSKAPIDQEAWIDPEVTALAGISFEELERYKKPAEYEDEGGGVAQPPLDGTGPHMTNYAPGVYEAALGRPDEMVWNSVDNQPPVKVGKVDAAAG